MYARLAFTVATSVEPDILIIDEVLGAGDAYFAGKCVERMRRLTTESGATVLFVSHDLASVETLCERAIWITRGRRVADGPTLEVCQQYWAYVLEREKLRLNARNARLAKKHVSAMQAGHGGREEIELLFRLVAAGGSAPSRSHKVARIDLTGPGALRRQLRPGEPMDNDQSHEAHLIDDAKYMNWGPSSKEGDRRIRCFQDVGGRYGHAPFVFSVPADAEGQLTVAIEHDADAGERVAVEQFDGREYHRLGELSSGVGWRTDSFPAAVWPEQPEPEEAEPEEDAEDREADRPPAGEPPATPPEASAEPAQQAPADAPSSEQDQRDFTLHQGDDAVELLELNPVNETGRTDPVFPGNRPLRFRLRLRTRRPLDSLCVNISVYRLSDGVMAFDMVFPMDVDLTVGEHEAEVVADDHRLRHGQYTIGLLIGPDFSTVRNNEQDSYVAWNRGLTFQVVERNDKTPSLALVRVPARLAFADGDAYRSIDVLQCPKEGARSTREGNPAALPDPAGRGLAR
jgi:hypothetical protein